MKCIDVIITPLVPFILTLAGCSSGAGEAQLPSTEPDIRGTITKIDRTDESFRMMVEADPMDSVQHGATSPKSNVAVTEEARLYERTGDDLREISRSDLREGFIVSVWFDGPVLLSYPSRSGAKVVVLEEAAGSE